MSGPFIFIATNRLKPLRRPGGGLPRTVRGNRHRPVGRSSAGVAGGVLPLGAGVHLPDLVITEQTRHAALARSRSGLALEPPRPIDPVVPRI